MLFLLDANVLIDAARDYYPMTMVPEFWDWLEHQGASGTIKIPLEIWEEITDGTGELPDWLRVERIKDALVLGEEVDPSLVADSVASGYGRDLTDDEVRRLGRDPFLIAYARRDVSSRCVVTTEGSRPSRQRANRHLPDVCVAFGVESIHTFVMLRRLSFSTQWRIPA